MTDEQAAKVAIIDSVDIAIQLPMFVWENIVTAMELYSIDEGDGYEIKKQQRKSNGLWEVHIHNSNCEDLWDKLKPIEFKIEKTVITIEPKGYTYMLSADQGYCQIALEGIPNESNEYRLGTAFLRNFYTVFDFDGDVIYLGVNADAAVAGQASLHNYRRTSDGGSTKESGSSSSSSEQDDNSS